MPTPILVMAYSRVNNLESLLSDLENISSRDIHISIDGTDGVSPLQNLVLLKANQYKSISKHNVTIKLQDYNLGLLHHFEIAFGDFFSKHGYGIILEDDIEFRQEFIDFVDSKADSLLKSEYWSICGHNPTSLSRRQSEGVSGAYFFETTVHTIWGWATSKQAIKQFLTFMHDEGLEDNSLLAIDMEAHRLTFNPLFRAYFRSVWRFKLKRNLSSPKGFWDNYWVLAGWFFNRKSLMSSESLTCEGRDQSENQSHLHPKSAELVDDINWVPKATDLEVIQPFKRRRDQKLIEVWGIHKKLAFLHAFRKLILIVGSFTK